MAAWPRTISRRRISPALEKGFANLERHVENVRKYGVPVVVSINRFSSDTEAEMALLRRLCATLGVECVLADHWAQGGEGAAELAKTVVRTIETKPSDFQPLYPDDMSLWEKTRTIAREIYGADDITADKSVRDRFAEFNFCKVPAFRSSRKIQVVAGNRSTPSALKLNVPAIPGRKLTGTVTYICESGRVLIATWVLSVVTE